MSLPDSIKAQAASLQAQVKAAGSLSAAPRAVLQAIKLNAAQLVSDLQAALMPSSSLLDTWTAPTGSAEIVDGVLQVTQAAEDQRDLALARGVAGRAASNLNQVPS